MAGFQLGTRTRKVLLAIGAAISLLTGGVIGRKTAPVETVVKDSRPMVNVPPVSIVVSKELLPAVVEAAKEQDAQKRKAEAAQLQIDKDLAEAEARVAALKAKKTGGK